MDDNIQNYRQPMVTAIGIILGFVLGYAGKWATDPVSDTTLSDYLVSTGLFVSVTLLIIALYRILNNKFPPENAGNYYSLTLKIFIMGLCASFMGIIISIFQTIISH